MNWIEKEILNELELQHGIIKEELDRNSLTIIEMCADMLKAKFEELKILNDQVRNLQIDNRNKEIEIEDMRETLNEIKNQKWEKDLY